MSQAERHQKARLRQFEEQARAVQQQRTLALRPNARAVRNAFDQHWRWPA